LKNTGVLLEFFVAFRLCPFHISLKWLTHTECKRFVSHESYICCLEIFWLSWKFSMIHLTFCLKTSCHVSAMIGRNGLKVTTWI